MTDRLASLSPRLLIDHVIAAASCLYVQTNVVALWVPLRRPLLLCGDKKRLSFHFPHNLTLAKKNPRKEWDEKWEPRSSPSFLFIQRWSTHSPSLTFSPRKGLRACAGLLDSRRGLLLFYQASDSIPQKKKINGRKQQHAKRDSCLIKFNKLPFKCCCMSRGNAKQGGLGPRAALSLH